jgi:RHS repeat-associated protein
MTEYADRATTFLGASHYRARYYDPTAGRFLSEDPLGFGTGINYYRYVRNKPVNLADPTGLYELKGFTPGDAAQMVLAIKQLADKLQSSPCCIDPKLRDEVLAKLQPGNSGSGVTFVFQQSLPSTQGFTTCAQVGLAEDTGWTNFWRFLTNRVEISDAAFGECGCPLAGTILHEIVHLTWHNRASKTPEGGAYNAGYACFGPKCDRPAGLTTP